MDAVALRQGKRALRQGKRRETAVGRHHLVSLAHQASCDEVADVRVVVDHQQPPVLLGWLAR